MNARTIRTLRKKFIKIFMLAIVLVMVLLSIVLNGVYYCSSRNHIYFFLGKIVEGRGTVSEEDKNVKHYQLFGVRVLSEDLESYPYFTALVNEDGTIEAGPHHMINSLESGRLERYAAQALRQGRNHGRIDNYYYMKEEKDGTDIIAFLNCHTQIDMSRRMFWVTILVCLVGLLIAWLLLRHFSYFIIKPEIERIRSQKLFITNASHELKTPLAVIRANTEVQEMMDGETEWTKSTRKQVDRMDGLIKNLVMIARAQEVEPDELARISISDIVKESVEAFSSMAIQNELELLMTLEPNLMILAEQSGIRQLTTLLVDNAFKYCDEKGTIRVTLDGVSMRFGSFMKNSVVRLAISNSFAEGKDIDYSKFFDRFYREDSSHNADRGGYGIGLSVAESLCRQYQGRIRAEWKSGMISFICEFPQETGE